MKINSQSLQEIICDRINSSPDRRITFAEYMNLVLYHPHQGYYASGNAKIGSQGDFFTSSSLGSDFGELLAKQFFKMWETLDQPHSFMIVEMGAGQGQFATDVLHYLNLHHSNFFDSLKYCIIEQSPGLKIQQQNQLKSWSESNKVSWHSWTEFEENSVVGCFFSNELVDAFPVHQVAIADGVLQEIYVTLVENQLQEVQGNLSTPRLQDYFSLIDLNFPSDAYEEGYRTEVNLAALDWLQTVEKCLQQGYLFTIDYGYSAPRYYSPQRYQGTLQCYFQHRRHNNPYCNLGHQDITTHVNFTALERYGESLGLHSLGFTKQGLLLMALGLGDRLAELSQGQFNLQQVLSRRDMLHQLIDPTGLGGFGVLLQGKGLGDKSQLSVISEQLSMSSYQ